MSQYVVKLSNGEDIVCYVHKNKSSAETSKLKISSPLKMESIARSTKKGIVESLSLARWVQPYSDEQYFNIEKNSIVVMTPASVGLCKYYDYVLKNINEVVKHRIIARTEERIYAKPLKFRQSSLPLFLEGIVHAFRINSSQALALKYYNAIRSSGLFDKKLRMYKVCSNLDSMPEEIGRTRVFTQGWLENESIWLHMEYKYMLELLKSGLYKEFFDDFKNVFVPFMKPDVYGRSILENSSFIASSAFPEKAIHGAGFIARLSGATAEFINIWLVMCAGEKPFFVDNKGALCAELKPVLPSWLFTKKKEADCGKSTFSFKFLGKTLVVYHNPLRKNTFGREAAKIKTVSMCYFDGSTVTQKGPRILSPHSYDLRSGKISRVDIDLR